MWGPDEVMSMVQMDKKQQALRKTILNFIVRALIKLYSSLLFAGGGGGRGVTLEYDTQWDNNRRLPLFSEATSLYINHSKDHLKEPFMGGSASSRNVSIPECKQ